MDKIVQKDVFFLSVSDLYPGRIEDTEYFQKVDIMMDLKKTSNMFVLHYVDRGFRNDIDAQKFGQAIVRPPSMSKDQAAFTPSQCAKICKVASERAENERAVRLVKLSRSCVSIHPKQNLWIANQLWLNAGFAVNF
jgi:hypothetical protein